MNAKRQPCERVVPCPNIQVVCPYCQPPGHNPETDNRGGDNTGTRSKGCVRQGCDNKGTPPAHANTTSNLRELFRHGRASLSSPPRHPVRDPWANRDATGQRRVAHLRLGLLPRLPRRRCARPPLRAFAGPGPAPTAALRSRRINSARPIQRSRSDFPPSGRPSGPRQPIHGPGPPQPDPSGPIGAAPAGSAVDESAVD
eukprot:5645210-Pyramimonas_sp.AAC.1